MGKDRKVGAKDGEEGPEGEKRRGGRRDGEGRRRGRKGDGGEISPPQSFLKVGAYTVCCTVQYVDNKLDTQTAWCIIYVRQVPSAVQHHCRITKSLDDRVRSCIVFIVPSLVMSKAKSN